MPTISRVMFFVVFVVLLSGCNPFRKTVCDTTFAPMTLPQQEVLQLDAPRFVVITRGNSNAVFDKLETEGIDAVLFGLTDKQFEILSIGIEKTQGYVLLQKEREASLIRYYDDVHSRQQTPLGK